MNIFGGKKRKEIVSLNRADRRAKTKNERHAEFDAKKSQAFFQQNQEKTERRRRREAKIAKKRDRQAKLSAKKKAERSGILNVG